jgi:hypothetical protein
VGTIRQDRVPRTSQTAQSTVRNAQVLRSHQLERSYTVELLAERAPANQCWYASSWRIRRSENICIQFDTIADGYGDVVFDENVIFDAF